MKRTTILLALILAAYTTPGFAGESLSKIRNIDILVEDVASVDITREEIKREIHIQIKRRLPEIIIANKMFYHLHNETGLLYLNSIGKVFVVVSTRMYRNGFTNDFAGDHEKVYWRKVNSGMFLINELKAGIRKVIETQIEDFAYKWRRSDDAQKKRGQ